MASEALFHLEGRSKGFVPYVFKHPGGGTHWWLGNPDSGHVIDPTKPQLTGAAFDYERGRRTAFLTKRPSRRAAELMRRVRAAQAGR